MSLIANKLAISFIMKAAVIFFIWMILYYGYILPNGYFNPILTKALLGSTVGVLKAIGYDSYNVQNVIYVDGKSSVLVADVCNGLELMVLYVAFFICFPGPIKHKLIFIPVGLIVLFLINVVREVLLVLNYNYFQKTFEFNHKYTYVFFVYAAVFLIWRYWLNNYSIIGKQISSKG